MLHIILLILKILGFLILVLARRLKKIPVDFVLPEIM